MDILKISKYRKEIMGLAALWIFYFHAGELLFEESRAVWLKNAEWYIWKTGYCGVEIFLFLSGMGLVWAIRKETVKTFYCRRFWRVYPAFWLWFTVSTVIRSDSMTLADYIGRITFYANWAEDLLAYKWYVAAIFMFYLWFPLYYAFLQRRKRPAAVTLALIAAEFVLSSVFGPYIREDLFLFIDRIPVFLLGVLAGHLCAGTPEAKALSVRWTKKQWLAACAVMAAVCVYNYRLHVIDCNYWERNVRNILNLSGAVFLCLACAAVLDRASKGRWAQMVGRGLGILGALSLEFYLTHELISLKIKSYRAYFPGPEWTVKLLTVGVCFAVSLVVSWIVAKIVEVARTEIQKVIKLLEERIVMLDKIG